MPRSIPAKNETKSAWLWAGFILGLIGINLGVAAMAIVMAVGDRTFRPLPDYSAKAVDWQTHKDLVEKSQRLGWEFHIDRPDGNREVRVRICDSSGHPISGGTGTLMAYHFTRAGESRVSPLDESSKEPGAYYARIPIDREGKWQISLEFSGAQGERFIAERTVDWSIE